MNPKTLKVGKKLSLIRLLMPGKRIPLEQLAEIAGYATMGELKNDLGQLFMLGSYPYSPADLIEVNFDGQGVSLSVPVSVDNSVRLNVQEWMALAAILEEDAEAAEFTDNREIIKKILARIYKIIPKSSYKTFRANTEFLEDAIRNKKRIQFSYAARKKSDSKKKVEPLLIFHDRTDYLIAWCLDAQAPRMYRVESMHALKTTGETFQPRHSANEVISSFKKMVRESGTGARAELLVTRTAWFNLSRQLELEILSEKETIGDMPAYLVGTPIIEEEWFLDTISRFGKSVILLKPETLRNRKISQLQSVKLPEMLQP